MRLFFRLASDPTGRQVYSLEAPGGVIGRAPGAAMCLPDGVISGRHAEVLFQNDRWTVRDLQSTNGTFLDDQRVGADPVPMPDEGKLQLGTVVLSYYCIREEPMAGIGSVRLALPDQKTLIGSMEQLRLPQAPPDLHAMKTVIMPPGPRSSDTPVTVINPPLHKGPPVRPAALPSDDAPVTVINPPPGAGKVRRQMPAVPLQPQREVPAPVTLINIPRPVAKPPPPEPTPPPLPPPQVPDEALRKNEELQAKNEELRAQNEELRAQLAGLREAKNAPPRVEEVERATVDAFIARVQQYVEEFSTSLWALREALPEQDERRRLLRDASLQLADLRELVLRGVGREGSGERSND